MRYGDNSKRVKLSLYTCNISSFMLERERKEQGLGDESCHCGVLSQDDHLQLAQRSTGP
mgnify:CR=1 FL=1